MRIFIAACLAFVAASCGAPSSEPSAPAGGGAIVISDAWAAPSPAGVAVAAGFLTISNTQERADALIGVSAARAGRVEIHEMAMDGEVMRMRAVDRLDIAPGAEAGLAPGGRHLMFYEITAPFVAGESFDVTLQFEQAGEIVVPMQVRPRESGHGDGH